jgi:polyhydroxybutyrate depolymerase
VESWLCWAMGCRVVWPRRRAALAAACAVLASAVGFDATAEYGPGVNPRSLTHDGKLRVYDIYAPASYTGATPVPLVIDIHGRGSSKTQQRQISGFSALADSQGFLVAYPLGLHGLPGDPEATNPGPGTPAHQILGPSWNAGDLCCGAALANDEDDQGFLRAMIAAIAREGNVDLSRVYATGLSNGGAMTQELACEASNVIAAFGPVAFPGAYSPQSNCMPHRPVPIITFQGLTDLLVPYGGGHLGGVSTEPIVASAQDTFAFWRDTDACAGTTPDQTETTGPSSQCERYTSCGDGARVELCSVTSPTEDPNYGHVLYFNNDNVQVAQRIWNFASAHTLPPTNLNGSWQFNYTCNYQVGGTSFHQISENTGTGSFTIPIAGACGSVRIGASVLPVAECGSTPNPIAGEVTGSGLSTPTSGFFLGSNVYETPTVVAGLCGGVPVARGTGQRRLEGVATEFVGGTATRIEGDVYVGLAQFYDEQDDLCAQFDFTGPPFCSFYALRNDVPAGGPATAEPMDGATVSFANVTASGVVTIVVTTQGSVALPPTFQLLDPPLYYAVETTASVTGNIQVCLPYADADGNGIVDDTSVAELDLVILHDGVAPISQFVDASGNRVCATVPDLSEFVLGTSAKVPALTPVGRLLLVAALVVAVCVGRRRQSVAA